MAAARADGDQLTLARSARSRAAEEPVWEETIRSGLLAGTPDRPALRHPVVRAAPSTRAPPRLSAGTPTGPWPPRFPRAVAGMSGTGPRPFTTSTRRSPGCSSRRCPRAPARSRSAAGRRALADLAAATAGSPARRLVAAWHGGDATMARRLLADARQPDRRGSGHPRQPRPARGTRTRRGVSGTSPPIDQSRHIAAFDDPRMRVELGAAALHAGWSAARDDLVGETLTRLAGLTTPGLPEVLPIVRTWWSAMDPGMQRRRQNSVTSWRTSPGVESQLLPASPLGLVLGLDEPLADAVHALVRRHRRHADGTSLAAALARIAHDIAAGRWGRCGGRRGRGARVGRADRCRAHRCGVPELPRMARRRPR
ncbi:hypothetical protein SVIOM342S_04079 [Streptomyces violaceorubidus]